MSQQDFECRFCRWTCSNESACNRVCKDCYEDIASVERERILKFLRVALRDMCSVYEMSWILGCVKQGKVAV